VRAADGTIATFNAPGAGTANNQGTVGFSINTSGIITGWDIDANNVYHGFLRSASGTLGTFNAPGAGTAANQGTNPFGINSAADIVGYYIDSSSVLHGFLRTP
jgi:hypothetical protein